MSKVCFESNIAKAILEKIFSPADVFEIRALEAMGKDRELLQAIADPKYGVSGMSNRSLREQLCTTSWGKGLSERQLSARVSRHLKLLRRYTPQLPPSSALRQTTLPKYLLQPIKSN